MKIQRVESIIYGVDDLETGARFFSDWGLKPLQGVKGGFTMASGQTIFLKPASDSSLPKAPEQGPTVREVVWGVDNAQSLEELKKELGKDREVKVDADGSLHTKDDVGFGIGFTVCKGPTPSAAAGAKQMNAPYDPPRSATPVRMGHVVYSIARADQQKAADFYTKRLQFRMTDHTGDLGDFMRANGSNDHHNLFFLLYPNRAAFNHVAFEVRDFDEIIFGGQNMKNKGWNADSAPGRHILGSNLFWYFSNPSGGNVEYFADMDQMDDNFQTRNWEKTPGYAMWTLDKTDIPAAERRAPPPPQQ
jgi:catechol 2,3-dioxygenase-like lactoylglutathione lyase family enzyme